MDRNSRCSQHWKDSSLVDVSASCRWHGPVGFIKQWPPAHTVMFCSQVWSGRGWGSAAPTREEFILELLPLHVEINQLKWFGHLVRMPPGHLPGESVSSNPGLTKDTLGWERFDVPPEELMEVARRRNVWISLLRLLTDDNRWKRNEMKQILMWKYRNANNNACVCVTVTWVCAE